MAFYNPYQQYNPYGYSPVSPQNGAGSVLPQQSQIIRVNGKNGAEAFRMAPNSSILLMDENDPIVWLKTSDGAGYCTVTPYNKLLPDAEVTDPEVLPASWRSYSRQQIDAGTKRRAIKDSFVRWRAWEAETKKLYEQSYSNLCDLGEIAAACKVRDLISDVDMELKGVDRMHIKLESIDYDLPTITLCQDELHELYAEKSRNIGVDIC